MDTERGVDISWCHHSKDHTHAAKDIEITGLKEATTPKTKTATETIHALNTLATTPTKNNVNTTITTPAPTSAPNGSEAPPQPTAQHHPHKHHIGIMHHAKNNDEPATPPPSTPLTKDPKQQQQQQQQQQRPAEVRRRPSWISSLSSKFSSSSTQPTPAPSSPAPATVNAAEISQVTTSATSALSSTPPKDLRKVDSAPAAISGSPNSRSGGPSFLQNALRRLSSSSGAGAAGGSKAHASGNLCPRRVLNVDPYRERCQVDDLHPAKLRRVSFSVDVEIAPPARYDEEEEEGEIASPPPPARRPSLNHLEKIADVKKSREQSVKNKDKAEAEALKHPNSVAETKEKVGDIESTESKVDHTPNPATSQNSSTNAQSGDTKKRKKRTDAEKAERRERKHKAALANGSIPMELTLCHSSSEEASAPSTPHLNSQDRPTTDPLRIYRRCCQLRETPVLKRIADQLSAPDACEPGADCIVNCIELVGFRIPLSDTVTLGDWLAIVPVRKLVMDDCDLGDEAVRVILAGLLAVKTPDQARFNRHLSKNNSANEARTERLGVIEKVSLKNNSQITREGWRHISCFINMSKTIKAIDISGIKVPSATDTPSKSQHHHHTNKHSDTKPMCTVMEVFEKSLAERVAKDRLEELVMAKCGLDTNMVESLLRGVTACGVKRLGLAYNDLNEQGIEAVCKFVSTGRCAGLDLGGNDLSAHMDRLTTALADSSNPLYALSVADCNLSPQSLGTLLPTLANLDSFKFIDLSLNHQLFATQPNATPLLRKYLPKMQHLRRIHLNNVSLDSEQCIALAEILPEIPLLAHLGILDNPKLAMLATVKDDEALAEEACAYYASLMIAVRVSRSIVSIDLEMPAPDSNELVKALGKQILAYALRNMERGPAAEALGSIGDQAGDQIVEVPDILLHIVGHVDGFPENHDNDDPADSEDYIISGTGVVKALGICLGNKASDRRSSRSFARDRTGSGTPTPGGATTPIQVAQDVAQTQSKAKDMSKDLLESARKIRMRLQPALVKHFKSGEDMTYYRLKFLDETLARMIERFEEEYPEVRQRSPTIDDTSSQSPSLPELSTSISNGASSSASQTLRNPLNNPSNVIDDDEDENEIDWQAQPDSLRHLSRHGSDASLVARHQAHEEGQMHRFGQQMRRSLLGPRNTEEPHERITDEDEERLSTMRSRLAHFSGEDLKRRIKTEGIEAVVHELGVSARELEIMEQSDPTGLEKLREAQRRLIAMGEGPKENGIVQANGKANLVVREREGDKT